MLSELKINDSRLIVKRNNVNLGESEAVSIGWNLCKESFVAIVNFDDPQDKFWLAGMRHRRFWHQRGCTIDR